MILHGQSLNAPRNTTAQATAPNTGYRMPIAAAAVANFAFVATNALYSTNWADVASDVEFTEGALQTPLAGLTNTLDGGNFAKVYLASVAVGARSVDTLSKGGPRGNFRAMVRRLLAFSAAAGYPAPDFAIYSAHGEADASAGTSEANYYASATEWYRQCQLIIAQALGDPTYVAPVFIDYPLQNAVANTGVNDRIIKEAIRRVAADLPNGFDIGPKYQWEGESDRVHATAKGIMERGEFVGRAIRQYFETGSIEDGALLIETVTLSGATAVVTFNKNIVRDATIGAGQNLNTALAEDGFEWFDNGSAIAVNSVAYSGATATLTLNSTPAGTLAQQVCRIAVQTTTSTLVSGITNVSGSVVRADAPGWASIYTPAYTNYVWASPRTFDAVTAP